MTGLQSFKMNVFLFAALKVAFRMQLF